MADGATTPQRFRPRLRPLSVGEILDVSIKVCLANWRTLLKTVLIVVVPLQILSTLLTADYTVSQVDFSATEPATAEETFDELNQYIGGLVITTILQVAAILLASAACLRAIAQSYLGEQSDWRSSLAFALRRAGPLLWLGLLYGLGVVLGTVLLIVPGVWLFIAWAFAMPALLVENVRGPKALGRSFGLVKGRWWRTFGVILLGYLLAGITSSIVQAIFYVGIFFDSGNDTLVLVLSALAGIVGLLITTPIQSALLAVIYFDLRVRKEGFDLELLARGIGGQAPADADADLWPAPAAPYTSDADAPWRVAPDGGAPPPAPPPPPGPADDEPPRLPGVPSG